MNDQPFNSLDLLKTAVQRMQDGDLSTPVLLAEAGEMAALAHQLEQMRHALAHADVVQQTLLQFSNCLLPEHDEQKIGEIAIAAAATALATPFAALVLPNEQQQLYVLAAQGWPPESTRQLSLTLDSASQTHYTIQQRRPVVVNDYNASLPFTVSPCVYQAGLVAGLSVPMIHDGEVVGAMLLHFRQSRHFSGGDVHLLSLIANQTAVALERAHLFNEAVRRADELAALYEATRDLVAMEQRSAATAIVLLEIIQMANSTLKLSQVLKYIARRTAHACQAHRCTIFFIEQHSHGGEKHLYVQPAMSQFADGHVDQLLWQQFRATMTSLLEDAPLFYEAVTSRRPLVVDDVATSNQKPAGWSLPAGICKLLVVPLFSHNEAIGLLVVDHQDETKEFSLEQIGLALAIAGQVTNAIRNARLYAEAERRAAELSALGRISEALNQAQNSDELLQLTLKESLQLIRGGAGAIVLLNLLSQTLYIVAQVGYPASAVAAFNNRQIRSTEGTFAYAIGRGEIVEVHDAKSDPRVLQAPHLPMTSQFTNVPLKTGQGVIGVLLLNGLPVDDRARSLLRSLADLAAAAIEKARLIGELRQLATTDDLTGLHNRRHFFELTEWEIGRARRYGRPLAVILFDVDHFKRSNDTYGHVVGDEVLRAVAARCGQNLREVDFIGRYGGEEMVVLLPESSLEDARAVAERLRCAVAEAPFHTSQGPISVTISLGLAALTDDCPDASTLFDRADTAMYVAKELGRNCVAG
jgi:diguanylate cyclase (GGDEF)-like protein